LTAGRAEQQPVGVHAKDVPDHCQNQNPTVFHVYIFFLKKSRPEIIRILLREKYIEGS
jgi:hypothetical protein